MATILKIVLIGVPILGIIVFVHELGHFIAARLVGVRVTVFSLGFGGRLFGFQRGETDYRVSVLPLGGYVKMAGDNLEEERSGTPDEFLSRAWYERAFIAIAGPAANFIMAVVCGVLLFAAGVEYPLHPNVVGPVEPDSPAALLGLEKGDRVVAVSGELTPYWDDVVTAVDRVAGDGDDPVLEVEYEQVRREVVVPAEESDSLLAHLLPNIPATVGQVTVGTPAYQAGLREGDRFLMIEGVPIDSWWGLRDQITARPGLPTHIVFDRDGEVIERTVTPVDQNGQGVIGILNQSSGTGIRRHDLGESITLGFGYAVDMTENFAGGLKQLAARAFSSPGSLGSNLAGPIAIVQMSADQAERSRTDLLNWLIFVSIALMTMNLLPIPVLDGGHILVALVEGVSRRPLSPKFMVAIWRAGMVFLLLLMTFVIANDGFRLVQRTRADRQASPVVEAPADATTGEEAAD